MCGVVGYSNKNVTLQDLKVLKRVMLESRIRGMHASGLAWYNGNYIEAYVEPVSIDKLLENFSLQKLLYNKTCIAVIAHARYSTSSLKYNQPLVDENIAIAHNGVISQVNPRCWKKLYGYTCKTKNDSELLLRAIENEDNPLEKFPDASIAAVILTDNGKIDYIRNAKRPLWKGKIGSGVVIASTYDILDRSGVKEIEKVSSFVNYELQRRDFSTSEEYTLV